MTHPLATLDTDPISAMIWADEITDPDDRAMAIQYLCGRLPLTVDKWDERVRMARAAVWICAAEEWDDSLLDGLNDAILHRFACDCAARVLSRWERRNKVMADPRSWAAITAKRRWLRGEISDDDLDAAWAAARAAGRDAARAAGRDAAWAAGRDAAWVAAWAAGRDAAWAAARDAARDAAWAAAWAAGRAAAWAAGRDAARDAAREWQIQGLVLLCRRFAVGRMR